MSKTRMGKRIASLLLSLVMMLSLLPTTVYAAAGTADNNGVSVVGSTASDAAQEEGVDNAAAGEGENGDVGENGGDAVTGDTADSALTTQSGDTETVVAKIGETGYATLAEAIADAAEGDTIRVLADATLDDDLTKGNITIEGVVTNGVKPTIVENHWFKASNVTIKNLKLVRNDRLGIQSCSNVTFENCEITRSESYTSGALVDIKTGTSNVFFKDCQITNLEICEQALVRTRENAENVVFTNCTLDNAGTTSCIYAQGKNLTLTGCTLKNADFGIYCDGFNGTLTVDNCTFTNLPTNVGRADTTPAAAFEFKNSDLAGYVGFVEGATVTFTYCHFTKASKLDGTYNPDWNQVFTCCDVAFENCTFTEDYLGRVYVSVDTPKKVIVMNGCDIVDTDGRTVEGKTAADLASTNMTTGANPSGVLAIDAETNDAGEYTGGTFVGSVENINNVLADGYVYNAADNTVKADTSVAAIGTTKYASLAAAIKAAQNGETVTLLKDVTENVEIAKERNLTLDLNGKTLNGGTGTAKAALSNLGTITIQDTSEAKTGTIKRDDNGTVGETSYYVIRNKGTMTIESGTVSNNSGYRKTNPTGSMIGSSLICNGDCNEGGTLTIKGGTFTQNNFIAIKNGAFGVLDVTGGTISSDHSAIQNWFKADITGGEIKGQLWTDAWKEGESVGETKIGGDAKFTGEIVMDIAGSVAPTLAINGGNLDVTNWRITNAAAKAGAKPAVSGGTFTSAVPEAYCAEGFIPTANADGTYGVELGNYVVVGGIKGFENTKFASFADAYDAIKPVLEKICANDPLGEGTPANAAAFDAVFTDVKDGRATLTYTITGNVTYDETGYANLLTMGRRSSHYLTNERHLINFKFVGAEADRGATLTVNSNITLPYEWWGEKITTAISFENLTITGSASNGLYTYQPYFEGIDFKVNNCTLKGIKIYNCANVGGSYTITNSTLDGTGAPAGAYAIHLQGNETAPLSITINGNQISGYDRGINIDQKTAVATISGNTIGINDENRSCIQLTQLASTKVKDNTLNLNGGNAFTLHSGLAAGSKIDIAGNTVDGNGYLIYDDTKNAIDLTYTDNTVASTVDTTKGVYGGATKALTDGVDVVINGVKAAQIGDVKYDTLQEAIDAVKANETIYVLGNIDLGTDELSTSDVKTTVKNVTIDLGGYTVTSAGKYTVYLKVNGWTIQNGTIQNTNASTTYGTLYVGGSYNSTTLKNLTVESATSGVYFAIASSKNGIKASITVEDGTKISGNYGVYMKGQPKPYGSTRDGQEILNVNGGEITGTTAAIAVFGAAKGNTKAGVIVNINGGKVYSDSYAIAGNGSPVLENTTINISGGKVFSNKDTAIYHPQAGAVTISGGEVYGVTGGVQMCAGTLNVTGGTISATGNGDVSGKTGDGSIPDGAAVSIVNRAYPAGAPTMTISGGTFTSAAGVGAVQAYGWKNNSQQTWDKPNAAVSGGTFSSAVDADLCETGYAPTVNEDGTYTVTKVKVAEVNSTQYDTLEAAIAAAKTGDTVKLLADVEQNARLVIDKSITLDLNGKKICNTRDIWNESNALIGIGTDETRVQVTITGSGTIAAKENDCYTIDVKNGDLTIENGEFIGNISAVQVQMGTLTINGGKFSLLQKWNDKSTYLINCIDDSFADGSAAVAIYGGTFVGFDPANNKAEGENTNFVPAGYVSTKGADGNFVVTEGAVEVWTGYSGTKVASYATVAEAAANLGENKWIVIGKDYTLTEDFTFADGIFLDVAKGATLTVAEGVTLTVANGAKRLGVRTGATLVNNGTIMIEYSGYTAAYTYGFVMVQDGGTLEGELSVPAGYILGSNGNSYYAAEALFEITYSNGKVEKSGKDWNLTGATKVTLLKDVTDFARSFGSTDKLSDNFVLDLGGHTLSGKPNASGPVLDISVPMTIQNGTIKNVSENKPPKANPGALTTSADVTIAKDAIIDGGSVGYAIWTDGYGHTLTVNGKVTSEGSYAITSNGSENGGLIAECNIIVNEGASITAPKVIAIYHPEKGTVTINGGTITGHTGIEMCAGQLVVNGGSITSNGDNMDATGSQNAILDGAAISIINRNYPGGVPTAVIKGGTFAANGKDAQTVKAYDYTGDKVAEWTAAGDNVNISGGTFSSIPTNMGVLCADGYKTVYDAYADMYNVVKQDAKITVGKRLLIGNDLTITYLVNLTDCTNPWVRFQFYDDDIKAYTTVEVKNYGMDTVEGPDRKPVRVFTFDFTGINPQRMTDTLKATVYATDASGNEVEYQVADYSVAQYCSNKLAKLGQDASLRKLIGNLVAYGAAAQVYQNYRTDNLVSTVVSGAVSTDYTDRLSSVTQYTGKVTGAAGVNIKGKTLVLSNTFAVRVYFTVNEGVDIANVSFNVTANGKTDTVNSFEKDEKLGYYYFDYANLNATQLGSEVKFESFVNGTGVGDMVTYSVNTYLAKKMPNYDKSSNAYKLMAALFNYGCACTEYASK